MSCSIFVAITVVAISDAMLRCVASTLVRKTMEKKQERGSNKNGSKNRNQIKSSDHSLCIMSQSVGGS